MPLTGDPLDRPADLRTLQRLRRAGVLDAAAFQQALHRLQPAADWIGWLRVNLLLVGAALTLAGVVYFFAYNWQELGRFEKLGLIELALAGCGLAAWRTGLQHLPGKLLLLAAGVLVGVFLAVYGQIYQTGADAFELFVGWAALILVWVALARFAGFWLLWLVLAEVGWSLYWVQVLQPQHRLDSLDEAGLWFGLAAINAAALAALEGAARGPRWLRFLFLTMLLAACTVPALAAIFDDGPTRAHPVGHVFLWLAAVAAGYAFYRRFRPEFACVAVAAANAVFVALCLIARGLFDDRLARNEFGQALLFSLIIIGATTLLTLGLTRVHQAMQREEVAP